MGLASREAPAVTSAAWPCPRLPSRTGRIQYFFARWRRQWEELMRKKQKLLVGWVVYKMTIAGKLAGPNAVCEQAEWDEMELARPGHHTLICAGVTSEPEAERLAREAPGGTAVKGAVLRAHP